MIVNVNNENETFNISNSSGQCRFVYSSSIIEVYMPMAYLYGKKFVGPITHTILSIREEIYSEPYTKVDWSKARTSCAKVSLWLLRVIAL
jgi:hypothetical protein